MCRDNERCEDLIIQIITGSYRGILQIILRTMNLAGRVTLG